MPEIAKNEPVQKDDGSRFWVSWWTSNHPSMGVDRWPPSLQIWTSEQSGWNALWQMPACVSLCALVDGENEIEILDALYTWFPDLEPRFCHPVPPDAQFHPLFRLRFPGVDFARTVLNRKENNDAN